MPHLRVELAGLNRRNMPASSSKIISLGIQRRQTPASADAAFRLCTQRSGLPKRRSLLSLPSSRYPIDTVISLLLLSFPSFLECADRH